VRRDEAVGNNFLLLDIGIPVEKLREPLKMCLAGSRTTVELQLTGSNRRGKAIRCDIGLAPLRGALGVIKGVILVMTAKPLASPEA
jgi:two-component system CheB/CheR fusion protein